jgi:hypothetical protein
MKVRTIKQLHAEWAASMLPPDAGLTLRQEVERAFYSGAGALIAIQIRDIAPMSDRKGEEAFRCLKDEISDYFKLLSKIPGPQGTQNQ